MITPNVKRVIEKHPVAFSTVDGKGRPNVIGVAFVKVVSKNKIVITNAYMRQTVKNLEKNRHVCLAVWDKNWKGYKLIGTARHFSKGKWKTFVDAMPENKEYSPKGAILVTVSQVFKLA